MKKIKVLVVVAHPDDEILGMGGTLLKMLDEKDKYEIHILFLSYGEASRGKDAREDLRKKETFLVGKKLGVKIYQSLNFPDNAFDKVPLLDIIKQVEGYINKIKPEIIYSHHGQDLNIDHRITFQAVFTSVRPSGYIPERVYTFEVLSSTEWQVKNSAYAFLPNYYVNIEKYMQKKVELLEIYSRETAKYPFPRSREGIFVLAQYRGMDCGFRYAEAFQLIRGVWK